MRRPFRNSITEWWYLLEIVPDAGSSAWKHRTEMAYLWEREAFRLASTGWAVPEEWWELIDELRGPRYVGSPPHTLPPPP